MLPIKIADYAYNNKICLLNMVIKPIQIFKSIIFITNKNAPVPGMEVHHHIIDGVALGRFAGHGHS